VGWLPGLGEFHFFQPQKPLHSLLVQPLLGRSGYAKAMLGFTLVRFFASRQRNKQPAKQVV
jgi:hypothetical protein